MASASIPRLDMVTDTTATETTVRCTGRITSDTAPALKAKVKPLFSGSKRVVLDLSDVSYMDSSGLGTIVGLYISAKSAHSQLVLINLNERLKELFSLTRLGQVLTEGRDPNEVMPP